MRLIDANELKRAFEKVYPLATNEMGGVVNKQIYDIIDNAPTVEPNEMTQDLIDKVNVNVGLAQPIKDERPQGEWKSEGYFVFCDYCGSSNGNNKTPFCPYCGAEMRGDNNGKEETT